MSRKGEAGLVGRRRVGDKRPVAFWVDPSVGAGEYWVEGRGESVRVVRTRCG